MLSFFVKNSRHSFVRHLFLLSPCSFLVRHVLRQFHGFLVNDFSLTVASSNRHFCRINPNPEEKHGAVAIGFESVLIWDQSELNSEVTSYSCKPNPRKRHDHPPGRDRRKPEALTGQELRMEASDSYCLDSPPVSTTNCMTLGKLLDLSKCQFVHL